MKKFITVIWLVLVIGALQTMLSAQGLAQSLSYNQADIIAQMDLDEDGMISIREAVADPNILAIFGKIDTDGDGKIDYDELSVAIKTQEITRN